MNSGQLIYYNNATVISNPYQLITKNYGDTNYVSSASLSSYLQNNSNTNNTLANGVKITTNASTTYNAQDLVPRNVNNLDNYYTSTYT